MDQTTEIVNEAQAGRYVVFYRTPVIDPAGHVVGHDSRIEATFDTRKEAETLAYELSMHVMLPTRMSA